MQINTLGFPLGAGMQSAPATGGTGIGFADALGYAIDGVGQLRTGLTASVTPPSHLTPKLAQTLLAHGGLAAQAQPAPSTGLLPGLQQPTSMSELMATAAKLPGADQAPLAVNPQATIEQPVSAALPAAPSPASTEIEAPIVASLTTTPETASATSPASSPVAVPAPVVAPLGTTSAPGASISASNAVVPAQGIAELPSEDDALPGAPAEPAATKPQKGPRSRTIAADADVAANPATAGSNPTGAVEMLAINAAVQPVAQQQQQQTQLREPSANAHGGSVVAKSAKPATPGAAAQETAQVASAPSAADFARAVEAKGESTGSEPNADRQPQPETVLAAAKNDAAAPAMPQQAHDTAAVNPARAAAPATPAEPVIEARSGHLGHSLGVEIARKVDLGEETLRIRLNPIELGRIEVTLAFDDKGSLQATVRTESAQAMDLLRQDAPDLARTLDQAGVRTDAQSFRFEQRGGDTGGQQAQQQNQQSGRGQFVSSNDDFAAAEPIYRPIRSDGQVDLLA